MTPVPLIDLQAQRRVMEADINRRMAAVLEHGKFILGPEVGELEAALCRFTGAQFCIGVGSGTGALQIALMALEIGPGDEVITSAFSFFASAEVIAILGATPVFVDIDPHTANLDPARLEEKITAHTRAIMPVSLYGQPADLTAINQIAKRHGDIPVIEDAAQSFGGSHQGGRSGNLSAIACTSFFPSKPLGCYGDGGAIFTSDEALAGRCRELRSHGQTQRYRHDRIGTCSRLDTLQAAVLLCKLEHFDNERAARLRAGAYYNDRFDAAGVRRISQSPGNESVFAQYTVLIPDRDRVRDYLAERAIASAVHYPRPLPQQPALTAYCCPDCTPVSTQLAGEVLSLPMHAYISRAEQDRVVDSIISALH